MQTCLDRDELNAQRLKCETRRVNDLTRIFSYHTTPNHSDHLKPVKPSLQPKLSNLKSLSSVSYPAIHVDAYSIEGRAEQKQPSRAARARQRAPGDRLAARRRRRAPGPAAPRSEHRKRRRNGIATRNKDATNGAPGRTTIDLFLVFSVFLTTMACNLRAMASKRFLYSFLAVVSFPFYF